MVERYHAPRHAARHRGFCSYHRGLHKYGRVYRYASRPPRVGAEPALKIKRKRGADGIRRWFNHPTARKLPGRQVRDSLPLLGGGFAVLSVWLETAEEEQAEVEDAKLLEKLRALAKRVEARGN